VFPPRSEVGYDWALDRTQHCRNGVEDLERSGELCGRAVVDNENEEGETKSRFLGWNGAKRNEGEALLTRERVSWRNYVLSKRELRPVRNTLPL